MSQWTPELKEQVTKMYQEAEPTPDTSTEIIKDIADELELSANGVRMVLIQAGVYIKKDAAKPAASKEKKAAGEGTKRVSKESAIADLRAAIEEKGAPVDDDILSKLTGKAAVYFLSVLNA
jgi:transposase-like protein